MTKIQLKTIIQEGESYKVEFKECVDKTFIEEVCAFANASGGRIFIGISDKGISKPVRMATLGLA